MLVAEDHVGPPIVFLDEVFALVLLACGASFAPACGSDARATDTCRTIETERCKRATACAPNFEDYFVGDVDPASASTTCSVDEASPTT